MPPTERGDGDEGFDLLLHEPQDKQDELIEQLQQELERERDARKEDRFAFVAVCVVIFDIMLFSVMPDFGGPLAIVILELLILIPLARRMGLEEIAVKLDNVVSRMSGNSTNGG